MFGLSLLGILGCKLFEQANGDFLIMVFDTDFESLMTKGSRSNKILLKDDGKPFKML